MKTKIIFILLCFLSLNVMGQGIITRNKKPKTTQTQPTQTQPTKTQSTKTQSTKTKTKTKTASKPKVEKTCDTCGKVLSKCEYNGNHPEPEAAGYDVTFSCNVSSATLYIDGEAYNNASCTRFLKTGSHSIKVTAKGYKDYQKSISVNRQNTSYSIALEKKPEPAKPKSGTLNGHEWVDLGLSVKWATCNVGASSPSDYGGYYAWGETSTKSRYGWDNCFDCLDSTGDSWGTYKLGGQTRITPASGHDTARENWGGTWRMPTDAENEELCKKCTWTWTSQGGHNGYKVTGPNGNSIFLPAAGYRDGTDTYNVGKGNYWSSTLCPYISFNACFLFFNGSDHYTAYYDREGGRSVRPVTD